MLYSKESNGWNAKNSRPIYSLDIETACSKDGCGCKNAGKHGLNARINRITVIAAININDLNERHVFRSSVDFVNWFRRVKPTLICHGGRFDIQQIRYHHPELVREGLLEPESCFIMDTSFLAKVHARKIPPAWLAEYEARRQVLAREGAKHHRKAGGGSLKTLAPFFLGVDPFWEVQGHDDDEYVIKDALYTAQLFLYFQQHASTEELEFVHNHLMPWSWMLIRAEERGCLIDKDAMETMKRELTEKEREYRAQLDELWAPAHEEWERINVAEVEQKYAAMKNQKVAARNRLNALAKVPNKVDYDSPKQMLWLLRDFYGHNVATFEGDESTGKAILGRLAAHGDKGCEIFLKWRKAQKILTAFIPSYEEFSQFDGCVHPSIFLDVTRTGRGSSSDPNCQQVPKDLKHFYRARPGYKYVSYDLKSIEAVILAWYSEDETLCGLIQSGQSIHNLNTRIFFENVTCRLEDVPEKFPNQRKIAKNCGFATFYGAGANRIAETMANGGYQISTERAKRILQKQKREYKDVFSFHWEVTKIFQDSEHMTNILGRPIYIQEWENPYMQGLNSLVQSSASDVNFHTARRTLDKAKEVGIEAHLILVVHDSITFEVKENDAAALERILLETYDSFNLTTRHGRLKIEGEGGISDVWE